MSFLSDLLEGKTGNLGNDLNPSNLFSDAGSDIAKNPLLDAGLLVGGGLLTAGLLDPALLGLGGAAVATDAATAGGLAADTGFDLSTIGPGVADATGALSLAPDAAAGAGVAASGGFDLSTIGPGTAAAAGGVPASILPGATSAEAASSAGGGFLNSLLTGATNSLTKNPLGIATAAGGLGLSFLEGNKESANEKVLTQEAPALAAEGQSLTAAGQQLTTYLSSGTLPPGLQSQVTTAVAAEKARIISNHAANGENTNPTQNSALAQELSQADINGINLAGQLEQQLFTSGTQLLNTGLQESGLSTQLYETLAKMDQVNNTQLMQAIASMAAALGGGKISIGAGGSNQTISYS